LQQEEKKTLNRLRNGERIEHYETVRVNKNGSRVNVSLTSHPIACSSGLAEQANRQ
jgi:hypothetical protein